MKNPFKHEDNNGILISGLLIGAMFAGAITYLYLRKKRELEEANSDLATHARDYLKKKAGHVKKHKSDVDDLAEIIEHPTGD